MAYKRTSAMPVVEGGTGQSTLTIHGVVLGNTTSGVNVTTAGSNGQLLIGSTGADPQFSTVTSALSTIGFTAGAHTLAMDVNAGFQTVTGWATFTGAGSYFDDTTLGTFQLLRGGTGYINGTPVSFAAQNITGLTAGNTYYIYIDSTGTIQKTTTYSDALFQGNVVLFECLRDSTPVTNNQITVRENHSYNFQPSVSTYCHEVIGCVIENNQNGANITLNGTQKIQINGADVLQDHGLETTIPDSGGVGVTWRKMYTDGTGKWATQNNTDTFTGYYNNAGTPTALSANRFCAYTLYVSKDSLNTSTPSYFAVLDTAQYTTQNAVANAIASGTTAKASNELAQLELAQLGYIIYSQAANAIVQVIISKSTLRQTLSTGGTNTAALVNTNTANFNNVLSAADTTVQAALDTIDDFGSGTGNQTVNLYTGAAVKTVTLGSTNTTSATTLQAGSTGLTVTTATGNGPISIVSGTGQIDVATSATNSTINVGTGAGVKTVTLGSATSTSSTLVQSGDGYCDVNAAGTTSGYVRINARQGVEIGNFTTTPAVSIGVSGTKTCVLGSTFGHSITTVQSGDFGLTLKSTNGTLDMYSGTGTLTIAGDASNNSVNIATGAAVKTVTLGSTNSTSATTVQSGSTGLTITSATANGPISIVSGTGTIGIATSATNSTVNIGTGAGVKTVTVGSTNTTSVTTLQAGSTGLTVTTATGNGPISIVSGTGTIGIATSATNSTVNVGTGAGVKTVTVGSGNTTSVTTVDCGTGGANFGTTANAHATTIGSTNSTSNTTLQSGSGALNVTSTNGALTINSGTGAWSASNDASATTVNIATGAAAKTVTLGSTNTTSTTTVQCGTGGYFLASATGNLMTALSSGEINYPLQPAFLAVLATTVTNVTGDATDYTVVYDTEVFDQNGDFDGSSTFTAPVTGRYSFSVGVTFSDISSVSFADAFIRFVTSNRTYIDDRINPGACYVVTGGYLGLQTSVLTDMDAADTALVRCNIGGSTKTIDIYAVSATEVYNYFSGSLTC